MLIKCCLCGERDSSEFVCQGAAVYPRPDATAVDAAKRFHHYLHIRDNVRGAHEEFWYHAYGCRSWLLVTRNTETHAVIDVRLASEAVRR